MRCKLWNSLLLLGSVLLCGVGALAQYNPPTTQAPYNPIGLAEVTGAPRTAVQSGQSNYQTLSQNLYLGGVPEDKLSATPVALSLDDAVAFGLKQNLAGVLATDAVADARGQRWQALSELLPHVITDTGFGGHQINVKASRDHKIRRLISRGESQDKAIELIDTTDKARAAFVQQYLGLKWPEPHLYHAMFNAEMGESCTATMLVECLQLFQGRQ